MTGLCPEVGTLVPISSSPRVREKVTPGRSHEMVC